MKKALTSEEFSHDIEKFFIKVCQEHGSKSADIGVAATLEAVSLAFRRMGEILTPLTTDLDPSYWKGSSEYWLEVARRVEVLKEEIWKL